MSAWEDRVLILIALIERGIGLGLLGAVWSTKPSLFECGEARTLIIVGLIDQSVMILLFSRLMKAYPSSLSRVFASFQTIPREVDGAIREVLEFHYSP